MIHETLLPSLQGSLSGQNIMFGTNVDSRSSRPSRNTEGEKHQNAWRNIQNPTSIKSNNHSRSRDGSLSSLDCGDDRDISIGTNCQNALQKGIRKRFILCLLFSCFFVNFEACPLKLCIKKSWIEIKKHKQFNF